MYTGTERHEGNRDLLWEGERMWMRVEEDPELHLRVKRKWWYNQDCPALFRNYMLKKDQAHYGHTSISKTSSNSVSD